MNWLDWLIIAIIIFTAFQGLRRGLILSVAKLAGVLLGFGLAISHYSDLAAYLNDQWQLNEKIMPLTSKIIELVFPTRLTGGSSFCTGQPVLAQVNPYSMLSSYGDYLAGSLTVMIVNAICFLALVLMAVWIVNLVGLLLDKVADLSFLGPLNHIGGLFFGGVKGVMVVMIILMLISPFQQIDLPQRNYPQTPGVTPPDRHGVFADSKVLPYFVPLFNAIDRPLPGFPSNEKWENPTRST
ncbi:MAG: CvpA family protein [Peptococcaceae bacterium]|nr:CvpA family protein [Candidatus Syntrophopropionicum ammoniitolerans]